MEVFRRRGSVRAPASGTATWASPCRPPTPNLSTSPASGASHADTAWVASPQIKSTKSGEWNHWVFIEVCMYKNIYTYIYIYRLVQGTLGWYRLKGKPKVGPLRKDSPLVEVG